MAAKVEDDDPELGRCMAAAGMSPWAIDESGPTLTRRDEVDNVGGVERSSVWECGVLG